MTYDTEERKEAGKLARKHGARFESLVRADLNSKGWIVSKNDNKVSEGHYKLGKRSYNPFTHVVGYGNGFPDFICWFKDQGIMLVESKKNKYLSKEEKADVAWIKEHLGILIKVAFKNKLGEIEYVDA